MGFMGFIGLIGLIGFIGFKGFIGFIGLIGFTGFIGVLGFIGFRAGGRDVLRVQRSEFERLGCRDSVLEGVQGGTPRRDP